MTQEIGTEPRALVVDDDALVLMDACAILEEAGFRPIEAGTADEALSILEEHASEITLLFTDVQMPGGRDGFDLARATALRWPEIKILVASGQMKPNDRGLPPAAVFVSKPFSAQIVHGRLLEILADAEKPEPLKRKDR